MSKRNNRKNPPAPVVEIIEVPAVETQNDETQQIDAEIASLLNVAADEAPAPVSDAPAVDAPAPVDVDTLAASIRTRADSVLSMLDARSEKTVQFATQYKRLCNPALLTALVAAFPERINAAFFSFVDQFDLTARSENQKLAVYALEKAIDLLHSAAGLTHYVDSYTRAIITNARANADVLSYALCTASLTKDVKLDTAQESMLRVRLQKSITTATTQRSSTKNALLALNIASYDTLSDAIKLKPGDAMFDAIIAKSFS